MKVSIFKENKRKNNLEAKLLIAAVHSFLGMWGVVSDDIKIFVELSLDPRLHAKNGLGGTYRVSDKHFVIFLNEDLIRQVMGDGEAFTVGLMECLAHECVHVKQYLFNELSRDLKFKTYWNGESVDHLPHNELPHEIEAHKYQEEMAQAYLIEQIQAFI